MEDEELYGDARDMAQLHVRRVLRRVDTLTPDHISDAVDKVLSDDIFESLDGTHRIQLIAEIESGFKTFVGEVRALAGEGHQPWLRGRRGEINWRFWDRYRMQLLSQGWADPTINKVDEFTDVILDYIPDPARDDNWDVRGLVVGHVQSGKTSNYTGLICKAADAGYKVIVVLAGMHKSLRTQTQIRLEEGFLGYRTPSGKTQGTQDEVVPIGVGVGSTLATQWATTRADAGDFNRTAANHWGVALAANSPPTLFVIKKNGSVLKNLVSWVRSKADRQDNEGNRYVSDVPLLVIDDEADQGSIDTKARDRGEDGRVDDDHDPTVLNRRIRELLQLFDRSAYVGYTATPFANVFIHEDNATQKYGPDLFPRDFIVSLPAPSNYVGPGRVFGLSRGDAADQREPLPIIRKVDDPEVLRADPAAMDWMPQGHKKEHVPLVGGEARLPASLAEAMRSFVLAVAARSARGQDRAHNSMLVHVTRYTDVQRLVAEQVRSDLARLRSECSFGGDAAWAALEDLWTRDHVHTSREVAESDCRELDWDEVKAHIARAITSIGVHEVNGAAGDILDYETYRGQGLNVIAIGGDKLSRGLTLEGLSVSYFLRASRMYDTLMQMGRWFGYRPGYLDLCRIYTTGELVDWFHHITKANEALREEFNAMAAARQTPREYGHRVLSHPELMVTSQVKMRDGDKIRVSFAGSISESITFHRSSAKIEWNFAATSDLVKRLGGVEVAMDAFPRGTPDTTNRIAWDDVPAEHVIAFLGAYQAHESATKAVPARMAEYINKQSRHGELEAWMVVLIGGSGDENSQLRQLSGDRLNPVVRAYHQSDPGAYRVRRLVSPADEWLDLNDADYDEARDKTIEAWTPDGALGGKRKPPTEPGGVLVRRVRSPRKGLLLVYALSPVNESGAAGLHPAEEGAASPPIIALAVSFPGSSTGEQVEYVVNSTYSRQEYGGRDGD